MKLKIKEEKLRAIFNSGLDYQITKGHMVLIDNKLLITQSKSLWRYVGELDWYPYYGISSLIEAYKTGQMEEYKQKQLNTKRKILALPKPNVWKDKKEEKKLKEHYLDRAKKIKSRLSEHKKNLAIIAEAKGQA